MNIKKFNTKFAGKDLIIETGHYAAAANASCTVQMGETVVLVTAVMSSEKKPGLGYFPLMVDYEEKLYATGRIKGSRFIKREGRPTDEAVLVGRFVDRAIRPLFDKRMTNEVQIIMTVLAFDKENDPDILGLIGASTVLHMSNIPWNGPIAAIRVSRLNNEWIFNASYDQRKESSLNLDIAGTTEKVIMIEAVANEAKEDLIAEAFELGRNELGSVIELIEKIRQDIGKEKLDLFSPKTDEEQTLLERKTEIEEMAKKFIQEKTQTLLFTAPKATKMERNEAKTEIKKLLIEEMTAKGIEDEDEIKWATGMIYDEVQNEISRMILEKGKRVDGRKITEVRQLNIEVGVLPRVHGTGHFNRGETQVLAICTLGAPGDQQTLDGMETVGEKRYMHHYNFPPFSVGEARYLRSTGRREIGHGALAEKALEPVLPSKEDFPYTIRVVSEVLNSNGSSSMASTCGSTLALMDAGVPISEAVAGIAIGIASREDKWQVITDIQDLEDGPGGMDFKVTGTKNGITAIQMDTKTQGLTHDIIIEALKQGRSALDGILKQMNDIIATSRPELSEYAPRILSLNINPDKIRDVIGPGGKMINEIIEKTGVETIDIEQDGLVMITAKNQKSGEMAYKWINELTRDLIEGEEFEGEVVKIMDFGAFVSLGKSGKEGLVHISELAPWRVDKVEDIVKMESKVHVKLMEIDSMGRLNLSMKRAKGNEYTEEMKTKSEKKTTKTPSDSKKSSTSK